MGLFFWSFLLLLFSVGVPALRNVAWFTFDPQGTSCLPWSAFIVKPGPPIEIHRGELLVFYDKRIQPAIGSSAWQSTPIVKMVVGVPGDRVEIRNGTLWINGHYWGRMWLTGLLKSMGLHLRESDAYQVPQGKYLMLGTTPASFDGRYWGLVTKKEFVGQAWPL
jgi:conjugal transfer pilin signal peptidase TrbI